MKNARDENGVSMHSSKSFSRGWTTELVSASMAMK